MVIEPRPRLEGGIQQQAINLTQGDSRGNNGDMYDRRRRSGSSVLVPGKLFQRSGDQLRARSAGDKSMGDMR